MTEHEFGQAKTDIKDYALPFVLGLVLSAILFLCLDYAIMSLQGLSLIFQP